MKKLAMSMVVGAMVISTASMSFADAKPMEKIVLASPITAATEVEYDADDWDFENCDLEGCDFEDCMAIVDLTFEDFMGDMLKEVESKDKDQLEKHFNEAIKLEKAEKYEEAEKEWTAFDKVFEKYEEKFFEAYEMPSYEDFMKESKDFMKAIDSKTEKEMKSLYDAAVKLEKEEKYDDAEKKWDDFFVLFDKFIDEDKVEWTDLEEDYDYENDDELEGIYDLPTYKE